MNHVKPKPFFDPILAALLESEIETPELRQLINERNVLNARTVEFFAEQEAALRARLLREHEELLARGQAQQNVLDELERRRGELQREENRLAAAEGRALDAYETAKQELAGLGRWTSLAARERVREKVAAAKEKLRLAAEAKARPQQDLNRLNLITWQAEAEKLEAINVAEVRLRARIEGRTILDPEYGLSTSATVQGNAV